jgi:Na+/proline symporter
MSITTAVFSAVLLLSFTTGAAASFFIRNVSDYYVAGGRMPWYLLTGTFLASNVSAGLFLGAHRGLLLYRACNSSSGGLVDLVANESGTRTSA